MRVEKKIEVRKVGILYVVGYYDSSNEILFASATDEFGENFDPTMKQLQFINEKLNEDEHHDE